MKTSLDIDFSSKIDSINQRLEALLIHADTPYAHLYEAARYSILNGAKRLRPLLTLAVAEQLGASIEAALSPACALEMLHTYSLIHDDLPCMDNSDFRRGRPSLHKVYNEGHAVLVGDFLLTHAFEVISLSPHLSAEQRNALVFVLAHNAGSNGMIGGQVMDLANVNQAIDLPTLQLLHQKKTGALLTAALEFGGIIACADKPVLQQLHTLGAQIGLAFQIVDDILDATGTQEQLGKPAGIDTANAKQNYVSLLGLQQAQEKADHLHTSAEATVRALPGDPTLLLTLLDMIVHRTT